MNLIKTIGYTNCTSYICCKYTYNAIQIQDYENKKEKIKKTYRLEKESVEILEQRATQSKRTVSAELDMLIQAAGKTLPKLTN